MEKTFTTPQDVEKTLQHLWSQQPNTNKLSRASLFTIIVYSPNSQREKYLQLISEQLIEKFPCRIIFIFSDEKSSSNSIQTTVALISPQKNHLDLACDYIDFNVSGTETEKIPLLILPYLIQDLPIYLLWGDDPCIKNPIFHELEKICDKIILDSENAENIILFAKTLLHLRNKNNKIVADLNWARTKKWRDLFRSHFYECEKLELLNKTKNVKIHYNRKKSPFFCKAKIPAIYIQAWLGKALNWDYKNFEIQNNSIFFNYSTAKSHSISVELIPHENANLNTGAISSIQMNTIDGESVDFARTPNNPLLITIEEMSKLACVLPAIYLFDKPKAGKSLIEEIYLRSQSQHLIDSLMQISKINEPLPC